MSTIVSPNRGFPLIDPATFGRVRTIMVEAILTFEDRPQQFLEAEVRLDATASDRDAVEVDVVAQVLDESDRCLDKLVKISLCYDMTDELLGDYALEDLVKHLCRNGGKYYLAPDQRDTHEQEIVDVLKVGAKTRAVTAAA